MLSLQYGSSVPPDRGDMPQPGRTFRSRLQRVRFFDVGVAEDVEEVEFLLEGVVAELCRFAHDVLVERVEALDELLGDVKGDR